MSDLPVTPTLADDSTPAVEAAACTTTVEDLIDSTRRLLRRGANERRNRLNADISSAVTTLTTTYEGAGYSDARLSIDLEDFHVWTSGSATSHTVERAMNGSTAASHTAGAHVLVNPLATNFDILQAANDTLGSLSGAGLFRVSTVTATYNPSVQGYDLTGVSNTEGIIEVKYDDPGPSKLWPTIRNWKLKRESNTTDFPSGMSLVLYDWAHPGASLRITYRAKYGRLSALADNVETVSGLHCEAHDLLALGAAVRIAESSPVERARTDTQGDTRRGAEVTVSDTLNAGRGLAGRYQARLNEERSRLVRRWGVM